MRGNVKQIKRDTKKKLTGSTEDDKEVHTVDTNAWIVSDTQIDMLIDTETKVASLGKVAALQFVLLDLQALLEDLLGLLTTHGTEAGDLFVSSDTE